MPSPESTASRERALAKLLPHNGLLAALPEDARDRLLPHLGLVDLRAGQRLLEGGASVRAFFPLAGLVSLSEEHRDGTGVHLALVGAEGMLGLPLVMGDGDHPVRATVQCAGYGLALGCDPLADEWERAGAFQDILLLYSQVLKAEMALQARCRSDHTMVQRLGLLMLLMEDGHAGPGYPLTAGQAADLLGASPEAVAQAVRSLGEDGVLALRRDGAMAVADRAALQATSCNCHRRIVEQRGRLIAAAQVAAEYR